MKNLILICLVILGTQGSQAQNYNIVFSSRISYLPSSRCSYEYYVQKGRIVKHKYEKESNNCSDLRFKTGRKTNSVPLISISEFIKDVNKCDTLKISISNGVKDSIPRKLLAHSNYFKNDSLTLIFSKFETEYFKPDSNLSVMLSKFGGTQIDGNWLETNFIQNQDTLLNMRKSYSGSPRVTDFKEWVTLYLIYHRYNLFQELSIDPYLSEENFTYLIRLYIETMKN